MIERHSLLSLEAYARERPSFRAKVIEHKKQRTVALGEHVTTSGRDAAHVRRQDRRDVAHTGAGIRDRRDGAVERLLPHQERGEHGADQAHEHHHDHELREREARASAQANATWT